MAFVRVVSCNENQMHIAKSPGVFSWSICIGILSLGFGAVFYGNDDIFKQVFCVTCCALFGASFLDDWEDCVIDRMGNKVVLRRANFYQKLLGFSRKRDIVLSMQNVMNVTTNSQKASPPQKGRSCSTTLVLKSGLSLPIIECSSNDQVTCEMLAEKISKFMRLSRMETVVQDSLDVGFYYSDGESSSESEEEKVRNMGWPRETITSVNERR